MTLPAKVLPQTVTASTILWLPGFLHAAPRTYGTEPSKPHSYEHHPDAHRNAAHCYCHTVFCRRNVTATSSATKSQSLKRAPSTRPRSRALPGCRSPTRKSCTTLPLLPWRASHHVIHPICWSSLNCKGARFLIASRQACLSDREASSTALLESLTKG
eukprot:306833-Chlamydomonas_euryale.AAC.8